MPNTLDSTGLTIKTLDEIQADITTSLKDGIAQELDCEEESPLGQVIGAFSAQLREALELIQAGFTAQDPAGASGTGLQYVARITGTERAAATRSETPCSVVLAAGTYNAGTLIAYVTGQPETRFRNKEAITTAGGTVTGQIFESEETGPIVANSGTLIVIAETVAGWTSVTNTADATLGALEESDAALRLRRVEEIYRRGSTSVEAIQADVLDVEGVTYATVLENDTDATDGNGLPPHSVEVVVLGGSNADLREAIFNAKAGGIQAYGTSTGTHTDTMGNSHTIAFSLPDEIAFGVSFTGTYLTSVFPTALAAETAILDALLAKAATQLVGRDVIYNSYLGVAVNVPGIVDGAMQLETYSPPVGGITTNIVIGVREYATLDAGNISLFITEVGGYP